MDKISELKEKLAKGKSDYKSFMNGFDAAMELQLPVKFGQFLMRSCTSMDMDKEFLIGKWRILGWKEQYTTEELFKEFLQNIYKYEK